MSKLQRSKFPKTDLLCVLSGSGAAVHGDGLNSVFFLGFCSIKIATFTLHSDKWEIHSLELWVTTGLSQKATLSSNWAPASGFRVSCQVCTRAGFGKESVVARTAYIICEAQCKMKLWGPKVEMQRKVLLQIKPFPFFYCLSHLSWCFSLAI